jgi:hypothetical protein
MGTKWDAFGNVMKHKGLPLIIMIRYSPIPWAIGNGLFAVSSVYGANRHEDCAYRLVCGKRQVLAVYAC